jgi:prepilin-type N-terminal cleavage/methylation domain-containing protein
MKKRGFTLIEILAVMAIIALLITLGSKGIRAARLTAKKSRAMVEIKAIETAIKAYNTKYGKLPVLMAADDQVFSVVDATEEHAESEAIISILTMADDVDSEMNRAEVVFLDPQADGSTGAFRDPWGFQYRIAVDNNYDGVITIDGETVLGKTAIASIGLYVLNEQSNTNDLIRSWN